MRFSIAPSGRVKNLQFYTMWLILESSVDPKIKASTILHDVANLRELSRPQEGASYRTTDRQSRAAHQQSNRLAAFDTAVTRTLVCYFRLRIICRGVRISMDIQKCAI